MSSLQKMRGFRHRRVNGVCDANAAPTDSHENDGNGSNNNENGNGSNNNENGPIQEGSRKRKRGPTQLKRPQSGQRIPIAPVGEE